MWIAISSPVSCNIYISQNGGNIMNVVIYARFLSHRLTEQSIEGQLYRCSVPSWSCPSQTTRNPQLPSAFARPKQRFSPALASAQSFYLPPHKPPTLQMTFIFAIWVSSLHRFSRLRWSRRLCTRNRKIAYPKSEQAFEVCTKFLFWSRHLL